MSTRFVYVWDYKGRKIPQTIGEVAEQAFALYMQQEEPSNALLSFANQMQSYANKHLDDEDIQESFGGIVEELKAENNAALRLELPRNGDYALREIVESAKNKSLIVYDEDWGIAFLAHGKILPRFMEKEWSALVKQQDEEAKHLSESPHLPRTREQFETWAGAIIGEGLSKHGFIALGRSPLEDELKNRLEPWELMYQRDVSIGRQYLIIAYDGKYPRFGCGTRFFMRSPVVYQFIAEIEERFMLQWTSKDIFYAYFDNPDGVISSVSKEMKEKLEMGQSESDVKQYFSFLEKDLMPLLDVAKDLKGIDAVMNGHINENFRQKNIGWPTGLIVASLVKNPNFDMLLAELEKSRAWQSRINIRGKKSELEQMVNYIRTEVKG